MLSVVHAPELASALERKLHLKVVKRNVLFNRGNVFDFSTASRPRGEFLGNFLAEEW